MSKNPAKDFGPIAEDYVFFERHATEAEADARAYTDCLRQIMSAKETIHLLDFGCGSGTFTARFLEHAGWQPERLRLALVEPVESARRQAAARLAVFSEVPVSDSPTLPAGLAGSFDIVLANHVLYYVPDLRDCLGRLIDALAAGGAFVTAIAARTNALIEFWIKGFGSLGLEIPYHTAEDVEAALRKLGANFQKQQVRYELTFPDTRENRMRIVRFLLADHLEQMALPPLLELFDQHMDAGNIRIQTASEHFAVRS